MKVTHKTTDIQLPKAVLDTTLNDLCRQAGSEYRNKRIGQVLSSFSALVPPSSKITPNHKYIYQGGPFTSSKGSRTEKEDSATAIKYLSLVNQRGAFECGTAPVIFFYMDGDSKKRDHDRKQVAKTSATLPDYQRPQPVFCEGPDSIPINETGIDLLACKVVHDSLERHSNVVPRETHWFLNSKRALADSGLPTPKCVIITVKGIPKDAQSCCAPCTGSGLDSFVIPGDCTGNRGTWLKEQSQRIYDALKSHPLPFVLKSQATFGGAGTFIVKTEEQRQKIIDNLGKGFLGRLLSSVNADNSHLEPATMLLSDMIQNPIGDYGMTVFNNKKGQEPVFLGVSKQMIQDGTAWVGSTIDYRQQSELRLKFETLTNQISEWLQSYEYIGPAGADVLEDADCFHVVDLNVRTTDSCYLPLLRKHFTNRELYIASSFSTEVQQRRDEFLDMFKAEFQDGRMCVISWYEDQEKGSSLAELVIGGGEGDDRLKELMDRVNEMSKSVTF
ncbi:hypothetical protein AU210_000504 [Fusarium oxysporum f. sp. radicis-cucumerinum]|uniref:ATP-grasp domain-containing protein n=1 Tax=Fusarium oxysporum f. sp. radicis-cucumerinum TaxID=327505 RepID=A0A2H3HXW5_FUSOX|nr:hypothetical protein AU210_000504 [Fusarium oxysporum f. sp. radicis-cucumerinum]